MIGSQYLHDVSEAQKLTQPGQAHWAGSGPAGQTCGSCIYRGYWLTLFNEAGLPTGSRRSGGCAKYRRLTGKHGPAISAGLKACRYFVARGPADG
jgi:hypothetical protein